MDKDGRTPYIEPNLILSSSFEDALQSYRDPYNLSRYLGDEPELNLEDVLDHQHLFIVAEPGQGKTRLLDELKILNMSRNGSELTMLLNLKQRAGEESIESLIKRLGFKIDEGKPALLLLDALDEVSPRNVIDTIEQIKSYARQHPLHKIYTSCRIHFFSKYKYSISGLTQAEFLLIEPLENYQSKQFLKSMGISDSSISKLFASLRFVGREGHNVLNRPRYLEMLAEYVSDNPDVADKLNRADLFEAFVNKALLIEDTKNGRQLSLYKKRFLEKLALVMEIAQVNSINEDELLTFIDQTRSDLKMALINQIDVEDLYEHSLLKKADQEVSFDNAEIQEYLAAKGILRLSDPIRCVFDIAIEPNLREPLTSWSNTLSFIIDEIPSLAIKLLNIKPDIPASEDESWHRLVTGSTSPLITGEDKAAIFHRVWNYYDRRRQILSPEVSFRLADYMPQNAIKPIVNNLIRLKLTPKDEDRAHLVNIMSLLGALCSLDKIAVGETEKLKNKLVNMSLNSDDNVIRHNAINALANFKDPDLIERLSVLVNSEDQLVQSSLQGLAFNIDKNHPKSMEIFVDAIKKGRSGYSRVGIEDIDEPTALGQFLEIFSSDKSLIKEIIEHNRIFIKDNRKFLKNIEKLWQPEWLELLKKFIISANEIDSGYYGNKSDLVTEIMTIISKKDEQYFAELLTLATK